MSSESFLKLTNQSWKVSVSLMLGLISLVSFIVGFYNLDRFDDLFMKYVFVGTITAFMSLIWLLLTIRCPNCKKSVSWLVVKKSDVSVWFVGIIGMSECPNCHYKPEYRHSLD